MKCPFRTINTRMVQVDGATVEKIDYPDCLENECPYFGRKVLHATPTGRIVQAIEPVCRRVDK